MTFSVNRGAYSMGVSPPRTFLGRSSLYSRHHVSMTDRAFGVGGEGVRESLAFDHADILRAAGDAATVKLLIPLSDFLDDQHHQRLGGLAGTCIRG